MTLYAETKKAHFGLCNFVHNRELGPKILSFNIRISASLEEDREAEERGTRPHTSITLPECFTLFVNKLKLPKTLKTLTRFFGMPEIYNMTLSRRELEAASNIYKVNRDKRTWVFWVSDPGKLGSSSTWHKNRNLSRNDRREYRIHQITPNYFAAYFPSRIITCSTCT